MCVCGCRVIAPLEFLKFSNNNTSFFVNEYWWSWFFPIIFFFGYWRYLYSLKQWFPLSATTIWPSCVKVKPWGPYKGQASVLTKDRNEPWLSKICIRELPQSATIILSWASTATPVGALNCPFPSPLEPKVNKNSPWESNTWKKNSIFYQKFGKTMLHYQNSIFRFLILY